MNAKIPTYNIQKSASNTYTACYTQTQETYTSVCLRVCIAITQAVTPYSTVQEHFHSTKRKYAQKP